MNILLSATFCFSTAVCFAQDTWIQRDSMNGSGKSVGAVFALNDDAYFVTGLDQFDFKRSMVSYDISQDDWDDEASLGGDGGDGLNRGSAVAFSAGGFGFCGLGTGSVEYFKDMWKFDPVTNAWTQVADFGGTGRREAVSFVLADVAYVGTGQDNAGLTSDFWKYEFQTNTWTAIASFPGTARRDAVAANVGGKGYVGTGIDASSYQNDFWAYSPLTDTWDQKADFPGTPRHGAVAFGLFPRVFIATGEDNTFTFKKDVWEYNYFGDAWTQRADFAGPARTQAVAIVVEGRAFLGSGYDGILYDDFWEYTPPVLSVDEVISLSALIYPNPATQEFNVVLQSRIEDLETIRIFNAAGQDITSAFDIQQKSDQSLQFAFSEITPGTYYICLADQSGNTLSKSVIIQ